MAEWNTPLEGRRFTPAQQAAAVSLAHIVILVAVLLIMNVGFERFPPGGFVWSEIVILTLFVPLVPTWDVSLPFGVTAKTLVSLQASLRARAFFAFALTFVLQFFALFWLLRDTGGPIDSPFAQLAVGFAVFTPILANTYPTIGFALVASLAYYLFMVLQYGFGEETDHPEPIIYYLVTALVVSLTVGLSVLDRLERERQERGQTAVEGGSSGVPT